MMQTHKEILKDFLQLAKRMRQEQKKCQMCNNNTSVNELENLFDRELKKQFDMIIIPQPKID